MARKLDVCLNGIQISNVLDAYIYAPDVPHEKKIRNMLALQNALEQVPWDQLHHAYGPATDTPDNLLNLLSPDTEVRERAQSYNPFWQTPIELLQVYGLPTAKEQLAQLLGK